MSNWAQPQLKLVTDDKEAIKNKKTVSDLSDSLESLHEAVLKSLPRQATK
jgi:hypothetical protein